MGLIATEVLKGKSIQNEVLIANLLARCYNNPKLKFALTEILERNNSLRSTVRYLECDDSPFEIELKETAFIDVFFYHKDDSDHFNKLHRFCVTPFRKNGLDGIKTNDGRCVLIESIVNRLNDRKTHYNICVFHPKNWVSGKLKKQRDYISTLED